MIKKETIEKTMNFLNKCREFKGSKFDIHEIARQFNVSNARFYYAIKLGYFVKQYTNDGVRYFCHQIKEFEPIHARRVIEAEKKFSRQKDIEIKKDRPLLEFEIINTESIIKNKEFIKPTIEDVRAYCALRKNDVNPDKWYAHYEAVGWKVGNKTMKDWKAAVHTWEHNNYNCLPRKIETFPDMELHESHKKRGLIYMYSLQDLADEIKRKGGSGIIEMKTTIEF